MLEELGRRIRQARIRRGLTQEELAQKLNTSQNQIYRYENGKQQPSAGVVFIIAKELNTTSDYLLGLTDNPERAVRDGRDLSAREKAIVEAVRTGSLEDVIRVYLANTEII